MGEDKAELLLDGDSFLSCQIKKAEKLGIHKVYVSGHAAGADAFRNGAVKSSIHIQMVPDIYRERGAFRRAPCLCEGNGHTLLSGASGGCASVSGGNAGGAASCS